MFEVRTLQDLARIFIRLTLKKTVVGPGPGPLPRGLAHNGERLRQAQHCGSTLLSNRYVFMSRLIPGPMDDDNNRSDAEEEEEEGNCRIRGEPEEEEQEEEGEESREGGALLHEAPVNLLRERILSLPLPEPLKMYMLHYREK